MNVKLVFSLSDNRGISANRDATEGEYMRYWPVEHCGDFFTTPGRYEWTGTALAEWHGWDAEQAEIALAKARIEVAALIAAEEDRRSWLPLEHPKGSGIYHKATGTIERMLDRYSEFLPESPFPANQGCWDDADGNPVPMTMRGLKQLWYAFLDRGTYNYGVRKYHTAQMMLSDDPYSYDFSGGWA